MKIALTGRLRSGKSTVSSYLDKEYLFAPFAFGDALKKAFHSAFPNVPTEPKPRAFYQRFGQWAREVMGEDIWIDLTLKRVSHFAPDRILIEDARQPNEIARLKAEGYVIIRINAPEQLRIQRALDLNDSFTVHDLVHETEINVDTYEVDYEIDNDGTESELLAKVDEIIKAIGGRHIE